MQGAKALIPATGGPGAIEVTFDDLQRLKPGEMFNDVIIDFGLRCACSPSASM